MAIDVIPPIYELPTRVGLVNTHKKFRRLRNPQIDISDGTEPDLDARVATDTLFGLVAHARKLSDCAVVSTSFGEGVGVWGEIHGVPAGDATGCTGFVQIRASNGGGFIQEGDPLVVKNQGSNGPRYECAVGRRYFNNQLVQVRSVDTGFEVNQPPDTVLVWSTNIPGIHPECVVVGGDSGEGLVGGHPSQDPNQHLESILDKISDPAAASNAAHYRSEARRAGIAIEQAYSYSAIQGPGVVGVAFTVPPTTRGGSRVPSEDQIRIVGEHLENAFGADDGVLMMLIQEEPQTIAYRVSWQGGWGDSVPWPSYYAPGEGAVVVGTVSSALSFQLETDNGDYTAVTDPAPGMTIALFDPSVARFVRKRIAAVTGSGPWQVTVDVSNSASDELFAPVEGQRVSPWSDNLDDLATVVNEVFHSLGVGEAFGGALRDGNRRKRVPLAPARWPSVLTQSLLENPVNDVRIPALFDRELVEGDGVEPTWGVPGVLVYLLTLGDLAVFQK